MFDSLRPSGHKTGDRAHSSPTGRAVAAFARCLQVLRRRPARRQLAQFFALFWIVTAISAYPIIESLREREARQLVLRLGGRYNLGENSLADTLPNWLRNRCGGEYLYPVRSVNLAHCNLVDEDVRLLLQFRSLEQINVSGCDGVSRSGITQLRRLPQMKLVWVSGMSIHDASAQLTGEPIAAAGF